MRPYVRKVDRTVRSLGRVTVAALLAAAVGVGACSPADRDSAASASESLGRQELQDLSSFERRVLLDKHVDSAELDEATNELVWCFERHGIRVIVEPSRTGPSGIIAEFDSTSDAEADRLTALVEDCRRLVSAVEAVWILQQELSGGHHRSMEAFVDCVRGAGVGLPGAATFDDAVGAVRELHEAGWKGLEPRAVVLLESCIDEADAALTTPLPGLREALEQLDTETWLLDYAPAP